MAKNNIRTDDICLLMLCGSLAVMGCASAYALVKDVNSPCNVSPNYSMKPKENEDAISSEYRDAVGFFDDFVDDYVWIYGYIYIDIAIFFVEIVQFFWVPKGNIEHISSFTIFPYKINVYYISER